MKLTTYSVIFVLLCILVIDIIMTGDVGSVIALCTVYLTGLLYTVRTEPEFPGSYKLAWPLAKLWKYFNL
jgi:hypothetical protein